MRHASKRTLARVGGRLPSSFWRNLLAELPPDRAFDALQTVGRRCNVSDVRVIGKYGCIEGSIEDGTILRSYAVNGYWRRTESEFFERFFAASGGGTFLDIGANIGLTTIPIARMHRMSCIAFEPEPTNFKYLKQNIAANCPTADVELFNFALFDRSVALEFELSRLNMGDHRVRVGGEEDHSDANRRVVIKVPGKPLDEVLDVAGLQSPIGVKISAQGAEAHIVKGGRTVCSRATAMVVEFYPFALQRLRADVESLIRFCVGQFNAGALMRGGDERSPGWRPVSEIAGILRNLVQPGLAGEFDYFRLLLVRNEGGQRDAIERPIEAKI